MRAGGRYVWHEPVVRRILLRTMLFIAPGVALWALLPLVATQRLGLGADGYGVLFAALGIGAVLGALVLGRVRARLSTNAMFGAACVLYAGGLLAIVVAPNFGVALVILVFTGLAWTAAISTLNAELALFLPVWVRARGLAVYMVVFTGSMSAGALAWGLLADGLGLQTHILSRGGRVGGRRYCRSCLVGAGDREPGPRAGCLRGEPRLAFDPAPDAGPVLVTVEYIVTPEREADFLEATADLRQSRLRTGGTSWELYRDGERPDRFVEIFSVPSWEEHLRQHRRPPDGNRPRDRRSGASFSIPRHGPNTCCRRSCRS